MSKKGIRLSEKHGANPSIDVCFFCGKDKSVIMFGRLKDDAKAPKRVVSGYVPCPECMKKMQEGRAIIEVTTVDNGMIPITTTPAKAWATGRWCVIKREDAKVLFSDNSDKPLLLEEQLFKKLIGK